MASDPQSNSELARVLVVDGSRVVRRLIEQVLHKALPEVQVVSCDSGAEALRELESGVVDLITTALLLPDMDGMQFARQVREKSPQAYMPIIVVSGDVQERLVARSLSDDVTDYFDKSLGFDALADFIGGYVRPSDRVSGEVLYVEDSRVVALATRRMLENSGLVVKHVTNVEDALAVLETGGAPEHAPAVDLVLTDVNLKSELSGGDLLDTIRNRLGYAKGELPVLVMTGDDNAGNQSVLLRAGANDLVRKPIEERLLIAKLMFQLRVSQRLRAHAAACA